MKKIILIVLAISLLCTVGAAFAEGPGGRGGNGGPGGGQGGMRGGNGGGTNSGNYQTGSKHHSYCVARFNKIVINKF